MLFFHFYAFILIVGIVVIQSAYFSNKCLTHMIKKNAIPCHTKGNQKRREIKWNDTQHSKSLFVPSKIISMDECIYIVSMSQF